MDDEFRKQQFMVWLSLGTATVEQVLNDDLRSWITADPDVANSDLAEVLGNAVGIDPQRIIGKRVTNVAERVLTYASRSPQNLAKVCAIASAMIMLATCTKDGPSLRTTRKKG
jgi:hypothetical protein